MLPFRTAVAWRALGASANLPTARGIATARAVSARLRNLVWPAARSAAATLASLGAFAGFALFALRRGAGLSAADGAAAFGFASAAFWLLATLSSMRPVEHRRMNMLFNLLAASCAAAAACYVLPDEAILTLARLFTRR